ncbi:isoprenyl transferase [bacterium]|nr:isoprenyl transferase [bacterium]
MNDSDQKIEQIKKNGNLPAHIAFIMDGNGRWAKKRGYPRLFGHREGVTSVRQIVEAGVEFGIEAMTFYTFSTENWKRPSGEITGLMHLLVSTIRKEVADLDRNNVRLRPIGCLEDLPEAPRREFLDAEAHLSKNTGMMLNIALSYGSRREIINTFQKLVKQGNSTFTEEMVDQALDTAGVPDPDLLIRTSGEYRLSNFLLWQCAYAEIYITDTLWPDFRKPQLYDAILDYQHRERRFGRISEQVVKS